MSFYLALYAAAEAGNEALIKDILKHPDACIDERASESFLSAAGALAKDRKFVAAELLMNKFGAAPIHVIYGLIDAGELERADVLAKQFDVRVKDFTEGERLSDEFRPSQLKYYRRHTMNKSYQTALQSDACPNRYNIIANAGNFAFIRTNKQKFHEAEKKAFTAACYGGHIDYIEKNLGWPTHKSQTDIALAFTGRTLDYDRGTVINRFKNPKFALHTLCFIKNKKFFFKLLNGLGRCMRSLGFNLIEVADRALKMQKIMESENLAFPQACQYLDAHPDFPSQIYTQKRLYGNKTYEIRENDQHKKYLYRAIDCLFFVKTRTLCLDENLKGLQFSNTPKIK